MFVKHAVNAPFDVCIRSFTEHYSRVLGVAYTKDTPPTLATLKLMDYVQKWSAQNKETATYSVTVSPFKISNSYSVFQSME